MAGQIHKLDIGTTIRVTIKENGNPLDISAATTKTFKFRKPSGAVVTKAAVFTTSGADGNLEYTTIVDDLDETGSWLGQVFLGFTGGQWHTDFFRFHVADNVS